MFRFTERVGFQFRVETFNTFNHTQYGVDPVTAASGGPGQSAVSDNISNANFGGMLVLITFSSCAFAGDQTIQSTWAKSDPHLDTNLTSSFWRGSLPIYMDADAHGKRDLKYRIETGASRSPIRSILT